jgi:FkbM family methyltransferase
MNLSLIKQYFYPETILDIGANIGQFHKLAQLIFPSSYIFSVEANLECESYLRDITSNYYIGLLAKDNSEYDFYGRIADPIGTGNSYYKELTHFYSADQLRIIKQQGIKLDDLFTNDSTFDLIKIDTQGSELDIMTGGRNLCKKAKAILLEVSLTKYNEGAPLYDEVLKYMDNFGFEKKDILDEAFNHGSHQQDILFLNRDTHNNYYNTL